MEVLTIQNQYQGQFNFNQQNSKNNWQTPLTPPPPTSVQQSNKNNEVSTIKTSSAVTTSKSINADQQIQNLILSNLNEENLLNEKTEIDELIQRLQSELRLAKSQHLSCTEVLLPSNLLKYISCDIIKYSEKEPCGIKGCTLYIEYEEDEPQNSRRISSIKLDSNTVSTFELYLTLKNDKSGWTSILPQFLKNLTKSSTIMISSEYNLTKNKLYNME